MADKKNEELEDNSKKKELNLDAQKRKLLSSVEQNLLAKQLDEFQQSFLVNGNKLSMEDILWKLENRNRFYEFVKKKWNFSLLKTWKEVLGEWANVEAVLSEITYSPYQTLKQRSNSVMMMSLSEQWNKLMYSQYVEHFSDVFSTVGPVAKKWFIAYLKKQWVPTSYEDFIKTKKPFTWDERYYEKLLTWVNRYLTTLNLTEEEFDDLANLLKENSYLSVVDFARFASRYKRRGVDMKLVSPLYTTWITKKKAWTNKVKKTWSAKQNAWAISHLLWLLIDKHQGKKGQEVDEDVLDLAWAALKDVTLEAWSMLTLERDLLHESFSQKWLNQALFTDYPFNLYLERSLEAQDFNRLQVVDEPKLPHEITLEEYKVQHKRIVDKYLAWVGSRDPELKVIIEWFKEHKQLQDAPEAIDWWALEKKEKALKIMMVRKSVKTQLARYKSTWLPEVLMHSFLHVGNETLSEDEIWERYERFFMDYYDPDKKNVALPGHTHSNWDPYVITFAKKDVHFWNIDETWEKVGDFTDFLTHDLDRQWLFTMDYEIDVASSDPMAIRVLSSKWQKGPILHTEFEHDEESWAVTRLGTQVVEWRKYRVIEKNSEGGTPFNGYPVTYITYSGASPRVAHQHIAFVSKEVAWDVYDAWWVAYYGDFDESQALILEKSSSDPDGWENVLWAYSFVDISDAAENQVIERNLVVDIEDEWFALNTLFTGNHAPVENENEEARNEEIIDTEAALNDLFTEQIDAQKDDTPQIEVRVTDDGKVDLEWFFSPTFAEDEDQDLEENESVSDLAQQHIWEPSPDTIEKIADRYIEKHETRLRTEYEIALQEDEDLLEEDFFAQRRQEQITKHEEHMVAWVEEGKIYWRES